MIKEKNAYPLVREIWLAQPNIDSSNSIIVLLDDNESVTEINRLGCDILGYGRKDVLGKNWVDNFIPEEKRGEVRQFLKNMLGEQIPLDRLENPVMTRDGGRRIVAWHNLLLREKTKGVSGTLKIGDDITEAREAQERLMVSEKRYRSFVEVTGQLEWTTAPNGEVVADIPFFRRFTGQSYEEVKGWGWTKALHPDDIDCTTQAWKKAASEKGTYEMEYRLRRHDGVYRHFLARGAPLIDEEGKVCEWVGTGIDITELKRAEEAAQVLNKQLELKTSQLTELNAQLQQFVYAASHDLREPLRMMTSFSQALEKHLKGELDNKAKEDVDFIIGGAGRMEKLLDDLLLYSRVVTRALPFQPVDMETVFQDVLVNLKVSIEETGATITHDTLPKIEADPAQMAQVLQNLISNAIKFHCKGERPVVHVSSKTNSEWVFAVKDNGIGIKPEMVGRLFVMFSRLNLQEEYPGSGMGLAITKRIIQRHGGRVWVESEPGKGSSFYFTVAHNQTGMEEANQGRGIQPVEIIQLKKS